MTLPFGVTVEETLRTPVVFPCRDGSTTSPEMPVNRTCETPALRRRSHYGFAVTRRLLPGRCRVQRPEANRHGKIISPGGITIWPVSRKSTIVSTQVRWVG